MRGSSLYSGGKDYLLPDILDRGQTKTKPQRHQSPNLTQTPSSLWMWEEASRTDSVIPLNSHFLQLTNPPPTTRNLFYMCEICTACRMFCGWLALWMESVFPHYVTGLFISLMANGPDSCGGFSPRPDWSTHPPACLTRQTQKAARIYWLNVCVLTYLAPCCLIHGSIYHYNWNAWWATAGVNTTLEIRGL